MFDVVYKLRHQRSQRQRWQSAATLKGIELSQWMRAKLDLAAIQDLHSAKDD